MKQYLTIKNLSVLCALLISIHNLSIAGCLGPTKPPSSVNTSSSRISFQNSKIQSFDFKSLNVRNKELQRSVRQTNTAITITEADFNTITTPGNSWLMFLNETGNFSMNIGTANNVSAQTWSLPANLLTYFDGAGQNDFIAPSSVPAGLEIPGANKVMLTQFYEDFNDRPMDVYNHYLIDNDGIDHLGTSYDLEFGEDDNFDEEPDFQLADVPLDLNDAFSASYDLKDYQTNLTTFRLVQNGTVDAFGTISTPSGDHNCLRISIVEQKYTRPNEAASFTLASTSNLVSFITQGGDYFSGTVSATSGTVTLTNFQYRVVVPTALLSEENDIKLNNDSRGVTINSDNDFAHPSAILDIKDDNLGVLIPRIAKENRPSAPAEGLLIYQIDQTPGFYYFDGTGWRILGSSPSARIATNEVLNSGSRTSGFGELKKGITFIKFEKALENPDDLIINLQLEGDGKGLYVSKKTTDGFEVRELKKGKSNARFSYSLEAKL